MQLTSTCDRVKAASTTRWTSHTSRRASPKADQKPTKLSPDGKANALQSSGLRTASWAGFVIGICCGMSITAIFALTILGS